MQFAASGPLPSEAAASACPAWLRNAVTMEVRGDSREWEAARNGLTMFFIGASDEHSSDVQGMFHAEFMRSPDVFGEMEGVVEQIMTAIAGTTYLSTDSTQKINCIHLQVDTQAPRNHQPRSSHEHGV